MDFIEYGPMLRHDHSTSGATAHCRVGSTPVRSGAVVHAGKLQAVVMRRPPSALLPANVSAQFNSALTASADPTVIRGPATIAQIPRPGDPAGGCFCGPRAPDRSGNMRLHVVVGRVGYRRGLWSRTVQECRRKPGPD